MESVDAAERGGPSKFYRGDAALHPQIRHAVPSMRRMPVAAVEALHVMSLQVQSALVDMAMAMMEAVAGATMVMRR